MHNVQAHKQQLNNKVRSIHEQSRERMAQSAQTKRNKTKQTKDAKRQWNAAEQNNKQAHLNHARQMAQKRAVERQAAKERNEAKAAARREAAREEKANNAVASKALADEVRSNQLKRARSYARRYVPTEAVETMEASDTFRRLYGLTDANGQIKVVAREGMTHSPSKA